MITQEQTALLKGIAILMMLWLHLFSNLSYASDYSSWLMLGEYPLAHLLTRACKPVPFFLLLSGYGLSYGYARGTLTMPRIRERLRQLYLGYWLTLLVFVPIGALLGREGYPGELMTLVGNLTNLRPSYNGESWFLLPFAVLMLLSLPLFRAYDRYGAKVLLPASLLVYVGAKIAYPYSEGLLAATAINLAEVQLPFLLGRWIYCEGISWQGFTQRLHLPQLGRYAGLFLLLLVGLKLTTRVAHFDALYALGFILAFCALRPPTWLATQLSFWGKHSMLIWLTHTFYSEYLFHDFVYGFRYPLVIFLVLAGISLLTSLVLGRLLQLLRRPTRPRA